LQLACKEIRSLGADLVAISPQLPEKSAATAKNNSVAFEVLSDAGNRVAREFGLVFTLPERLRPIYTKYGADLPTANGDETFELPVAATYVIAAGGTIFHAFLDPDYTNRMEPGDIVRVLKRIASK
jgi:peroxiredoxin